MLIPRRSVRTSQPQQVVDKASPGDWLSLVVGGADVYRFGKSTRIFDNQTYPQLASDLVPRSECTIILFGKSTTTAPHGEFGILNDVDVDGRAGAHVPYTDGTVYFDFGGATNGSSRCQVSGLSFGEDVWIFTAGPRGMEIWQNGILRASNSGTPMRVVISGKFWGLGQNSANTNGARDAHWFLHGISSKQFPRPYIEKIGRNPWELFEDEEEYLFIPAAAGGGSQTLAPSLHTNGHVFYAPTVSQSGASQTVSPTLYTNTASFFAPTLTASNSLSASLHTNVQSFFAPTVSIAGGPQQLTANRLDSASTFYSPVLAPGAVSVSPSLYNNTQAFYGLTLTASKTLAPALFTNSNTLYDPVVSLGSAPQVIAPPLFINTQSYFSHTVNTGQVQLFPTLFSNASLFFQPTVAAPGVMTLTQADINAIVAALSTAMLPVNAVQIRGATVIGNGTPNDPWRNADTAKRPYIKP